MAAAVLGFAVLKDGGISLAFSGGKGRWLAGAAGAIGFAISCLAAVGASSHGRQEAADPKAQQISAYEAAVKQEKTLEARLATLGKVKGKADAETALSRVNVDAAIMKRTQSCAVTAHASARIQDVNVEACRPYTAAKGEIAKAVEVEAINGKLEDVRKTIGGGRPASADAQASTLAKLLHLDRIDGVQAWMNMILALAIEIAAPLAWASFATAIAVKTPEMPVQQRPVAPSQPPQLTVVARRGKLADDEIEAMILRDLARGHDHGQEHYAEQFGVSIATISRAIDRLTGKPGARIADQRVGTRRKLIAV